MSGGGPAQAIARRVLQHACDDSQSIAGPSEQEGGEHDHEYYGKYTGYDGAYCTDLGCFTKTKKQVLQNKRSKTSERVQDGALACCCQPGTDRQLDLQKLVPVPIEPHVEVSEWVEREHTEVPHGEFGASYTEFTTNNYKVAVQYCRIFDI